MSFLDTLCKDIARMQRESIEKSKKRHQEMVASFGDEFADKIQWNPLLGHGFSGNRKIIAYTSNKEVMTIYNNYIKIFLQKIISISISVGVIYLFFTMIPENEGIVETILELRETSHTNPLVYYILLGTIALIPIAMVYRFYIFIKRGLTETYKIIVNKDFHTMTLKTFLAGEKEIYLGDVQAIQIIEKVLRVSKRHYRSFYEVNLVLEDTTRKNIINNSSKDDVVRQAEELGTYVNKPVWNAIRI